MSCLSRALFVVLALFLALSGFAVYQHGVCGFFTLLLANSATVTLSTDLVISLTLISVWLWRDARSRGVSPYPFLLMTVALGSAGPLLYLALKAMKKTDCGSCV